MTAFDKAIAHVDAAAEAEDCERMATYYSNMRRPRFEELCDQAAGQLETDGERRAMAEIRSEGPRAVARTFRAEAAFWRGRVPK